MNIHDENNKQRMLLQIRNLSEEEKKRSIENLEKNKFDSYRDKVRSSVINLISHKDAPWLKSHDGNIELSYFPETGHIAKGFTAVWLKIREQELYSSDPRWFSRKDVFEKGYYIGHNQKATIMCFRDKNNDIKFSYYWNACQLKGIPTYKKNYSVSTKKPPLYYPQSTGFGKNRKYHPHETLRADITNWLTSIETHTAYEPRGLNRTEQVKDFLIRSNPGIFFFIAHESSLTSKNILKKENIRNLSVERKTELDLER